jgi:hypothetical protein
VGIHRAQENGLLPRRLLVSRTQLDKLEERGYLDPDLRGNQADEADAIEAAYWFVSVGEQPSIQPSVSWMPGPPSSPLLLRSADKIRTTEDCRGPSRVPTATSHGLDRDL